MTQTQDDWGPWVAGNVKARLRTNSDDAGMVWSLMTNNLFIVSVTPFQCDWGWCVHVVVRAKADAPITWAVKQRLKDELLGPQRVAVEVFPAQKDLVDQADAYHLWVLPENFQLPFGLEGISE